MDDVCLAPVPGEPPAGDTTVTAELRARSASFTDLFGWHDAATGEGQLLDARTLADFVPLPITVGEDDRISLESGTGLRGRLAPAFFTEDACNPAGEDRVDEVNLDGDPSLPDLVFKDGRDDDRNDLVVSLRIEDAAGVTTAAAMPSAGAGVPDPIPAADAHPAG